MQIVMGWPEWIVVSFLVLGMWTRIIKMTSLPKKFDVRAGAALGIITYIVSWTILLYWGGFFS